MSQDLSAQQAEKVDTKKLASELDANLDQGLSESEAQDRLEKHGPNKIEEENNDPIQQLLLHFWGPIPWLIEVAAVLAAVAGHWEDFGVIMAMLLVNVGVGFWHESRAQGAIQALKESLSPKAHVIRGGNAETIEAENLVPADVISLRAGDVVPADVKLFGKGQVSVDESALTGESLPVDKKNDDVCYSGTSIKRGEARVLVIATGNDTRFARTVELVAQAEEKSHFQKTLLRIGYYLIAVTGVLVPLVCHPRRR